MTEPVQSSRDPDWIETEEIRGPGADFGPGLLLIGLTLCIVLVVALS